MYKNQFENQTRIKKNKKKNKTRKQPAGYSIGPDGSS